MTPDELGMSTSWNMILSASVFWHCWLGDRKGIQPADVLVIMIWLEFSTSYSFSCHHSPPPSSVAPIISRMMAFWHRLTWFSWKTDMEWLMSLIAVVIDEAWFWCTVKWLRVCRYNVRPACDRATRKWLCLVRMSTATETLQQWASLLQWRHQWRHHGAAWWVIWVLGLRQCTGLDTAVSGSLSCWVVLLMLMLTWGSDSRLLIPRTFPTM